MMDGIDDVIESMERFADRHWMHDEGQNVREFAQRLRAAKKACTAEATLPFDDLISRMKARCIDEEHSPELWPFIEEMEAAVKRERAIGYMTKEANERFREHLDIALKNRQVGNAAAMRKALETLLNLAYVVQDENSECGPKTSVPSQFIIDVAKSALSAPPRNCEQLAAPTDSNGNTIHVADKVHMLNTDSRGDHEWDDEVNSLEFIGSVGGDEWLIHGHNGSAWACECEVLKRKGEGDGCD